MELRVPKTEEVELSIKGYITILVMKCQIIEK